MRIHCVVMNTRLMKTLIKLWLATGLPYESITGTVAINDMNFNQTFMDNPRPSFFCADNEWPLCFVAGALLSLSLSLYIYRHYNAWYGLGAIYQRQEKYHLAEIHYRRALSINPTSIVLLCSLALVLRLRNKLNEAQECVDLALRCVCVGRL